MIKETPGQLTGCSFLRLSNYRLLAESATTSDAGLTKPAKASAALGNCLSSGRIGRSLSGGRGGCIGGRGDGQAASGCELGHEVNDCRIDRGSGGSRGCGVNRSRCWIGCCGIDRRGALLEDMRELLDADGFLHVLDILVLLVFV
jgi:hypothetical protein